MKKKYHIAGTRFKVIRVDSSDATYLIEDIYMENVLSNQIWVRCNDALEQGKYYKGSISKHPKGVLMKTLPIFTLKKIPINP